MTRKAVDNVAYMDNEVIRCFIDSNTGKEATTQDERFEIASQWCAGDYSYHHEIADARGLLPIALIVACLIDVNHPLLVSGRGVSYNSLECSMLVISTMHNRITVSQPVKHSFHKSPQLAYK